jgi:hypothetical protein
MKVCPNLHNAIWRGFNGLPSNKKRRLKNEALRQEKQQLFATFVSVVAKIAAWGHFV